MPKEKPICDCELGKEAVVIIEETNDLLCVDCARNKREFGWCAAEAARITNTYGVGWTVAQANAERAPHRQPARKHTRRKNGWW